PQESGLRFSCVLGGRMETALYRHFDAEGRLLYVGISLNAFSRLMQHRRDSVWFRQIASVTIEWFPTRGKAVDAEVQAIRNERPLHNVIHVLPDIILDLMRGPKGYMLEVPSGRVMSMLPTCSAASAAWRLMVTGTLSSRGSSAASAGSIRNKGFFSLGLAGPGRDRTTSGRESP